MRYLNSPFTSLWENGCSFHTGCSRPVWLEDGDCMSRGLAAQTSVSGIRVILDEQYNWMPTGWKQNNIWSTKNIRTTPVMWTKHTRKSDDLTEIETKTTLHVNCIWPTSRHTETEVSFWCLIVFFRRAVQSCPWQLTSPRHWQNLSRDMKTSRWVSKNAPVRKSFRMEEKWRKEGWFNRDVHRENGGTLGMLPWTIIYWIGLLGRG